MCVCVCVCVCVFGLDLKRVSLSLRMQETQKMADGQKEGRARKVKAYRVRINVNALHCSSSAIGVFYMKRWVLLVCSLPRKRFRCTLTRGYWREKMFSSSLTELNWTEQCESRLVYCWKKLKPLAADRHDFPCVFIHQIPLRRSCLRPWLLRVQWISWMAQCPQAHILIVDEKQKY